MGWTIAFVVLALLGGFAIWRWLWLCRQRNDVLHAPHEDGLPRFDTTMGELRDLREALRPPLRRPPLK
jgi:hypothetical protein